MKNKREEKDFIKKASYYNHLRRAMSTTGYFTLFRELTMLPGMGKSEAMLLSDLINRSEMVFNRRAKLLLKAHKDRDKRAESKAKAVKIDKDHFFACSVKFLQSKKHPPLWSPKEQERLIPRLVKTGFIKIRRQGLSRLRWVWIDLEAIHTALDYQMYGQP